jgi:hypothetical protein
MLDKFIQWFFMVGEARANNELRRMGYDPKKLREEANENLKDWV